MVNVEVSKMGNESPLAVIRKFSRRVQGTGLIQLTRKRRYYERATSKAVAKKRALKRIKRRDEYRRAVKDGKIAEAPARRGYQNRGSQQHSQSSQASREQTSSPPIAR